jgi:hypothetical protein
MRPEYRALRALLEAHAARHLDAAHVRLETSKTPDLRLRGELVLNRTTSAQARTCSSESTLSSGTDRSAVAASEVSC